ncbi:hypothetical protein L596_022560 [Steinernema carpocapsae]|uniref:Chondroitin proteoglycan 4 domain-containing protein n=1 Tax=Steinernema carpocapsae TaxID=34508 RepID=A0A4U5MM43_STECR|nr:hypothetical protein L596_022560 [Steinernema carpocapsae]
MLFKAAVFFLLLSVSIAAEETSAGNVSDSRKVYCFRTCFANLVLTSPFTEGNLVEPMCPVFAFLPACLYKCDRRLMQDFTISNLDARCKLRESRIRLHRPCMDRLLPDIFKSCSKSCQQETEKSDSIYEEINAHCRKINCRLPCVVTELNKRCKVAGNHVYGTYAVPFLSMMTAMEQNANMRQALIGLPKHCGPLFNVDSSGEDLAAMKIDWEDWKKPRNFQEVAPRDTTTVPIPTSTKKPKERDEEDFEQDEELEDILSEFEPDE